MSKSAKIYLSKSVFHVYNYPNFSQFFLSIQVMWLTQDNQGEELEILYALKTILCGLIWSTDATKNEILSVAFLRNLNSCNHLAFFFENDLPRWLCAIYNIHIRITFFFFHNHKTDSFWKSKVRWVRTKEFLALVTK